MDSVLLKAQELSYSYHTLNGETPALDRVSFCLYRKEFLAIVGPSGCGKSTILSLIAGLLTPGSGGITFYGENGHQPGIGYMLQHDLLFEWRNVWQNVTLGLEIAHKDTARNLERVRRMLSDYGLLEFQHKKPSQLSGGMRQRVVIAIAVACSPKILICDEPTTALDVTIQAQILQLLKEMRFKYDLTIVMITHDLGVVANIADRVAVMYAGDIVEIGTADEIYYDPRHPYTWALLSSMPQMGVKGEDLFNIVGTPPNLFAEIRGDAFAPRNPQALKIDFVKRPPYFEVTPTHKAKTWLLDPRAPKIEPPAAVKMLREEGL